VENSTIMFEGVDIPDFGDQEYPYGVLEVTQRCNLRCKTCFFFQAFRHPGKDIPDDVLIPQLRALQKRHQIKFMSWVGGEPSLRPIILKAATKIFPYNMIFSNGIRSIPDLPMAFGISLDGPPEINDAIRGKGVYEKAMKNIRNAPRKVFVQSVITRKNFPFLDEFTAQLSKEKNLTGIIYSIYIPQKGDASSFGFNLTERDQVIEKLLMLKDEYGEFFLLLRRAIELMHSSNSSSITKTCDMRVNSLAMDYTLRRRKPCCYGENVDCDLCAVPTPFVLAAKEEMQQSENIGSTDFHSIFPLNLPEIASPYTRCH
jgi:Fe-coproporphyrin III synthase